MRIEIRDDYYVDQVRAAALSAALDLAEITGPPVTLDDLLEAAKRFEGYIVNGAQ